MSSPPSNLPLRSRILARLANHGVNEEAVAELLAQVMKGEKVTREYTVDRAGNEVLTSVTRSSTPKDAAQGLMLFDAMNGGELGLSPPKKEDSSPQEHLYRRFAPAVDRRIIQLPDSSPAQSIQPPSTDHNASPAQEVLHLITAEEPSEPDDSDQF